MSSLDYDRAAGLVAELFAEAEIAYQKTEPPPVENAIAGGPQWQERRIIEIKLKGETDGETQS